VRRLELPALTRDAVATLARPQGIDPDRLHQATGGNPFFVTEVLGASSGEVPPTVRDAAGMLRGEGRGLRFRHELAGKLGVRSRQEATRAAAARGIVPGPG
jgi:hypothetical protein